MEKSTNSPDYESIRKKVLEQFRSGKSLTGKAGAFAPLLKEFLETALQAELEEHFRSDDPVEGTNGKNGKVSKTIKPHDGEVQLISSRYPPVTCFILSM